MKTNRVGPYEAGWLTFLVQQGIATEKGARDAMRRVAAEATEALERRRRNRNRKKRRGE